MKRDRSKHNEKEDEDEEMSKKSHKIPKRKGEFMLHQDVNEEGVLNHDAAYDSTRSYSPSSPAKESSHKVSASVELKTQHLPWTVTMSHQHPTLYHYERLIVFPVLPPRDDIDYTQFDRNGNPITERPVIRNSSYQIDSPLSFPALSNHMQTRRELRNPTPPNQPDDVPDDVVVQPQVVEAAAQDEDEQVVHTQAQQDEVEQVIQEPLDLPAPPVIQEPVDLPAPLVIQEPVLPAPPVIQEPVLPAQDELEPEMEEPSWLNDLFGD